MRTLPSVQQQRGAFEVEHVVIDGGSGSDIEAYLRSRSSALGYWQSRSDGGRYDAMNIGMSRCTGDLVWFMHSGDCFSDPDAVSAALDSFGSADSSELRKGWGYGRARLVDASGRGKGEFAYPRYQLRRFAVGDKPIPHQATFFGAELLDRLGTYDTDFGIAADQLYMLRAGMLAKPRVLDRVVCDFDTTGVGSMRSPHEHFRDARRAWHVAGYFPFGNVLAAQVASQLAEVGIYGRLAARRLLRRS
ncbi:MAG: glycosyltransferase [Aldersonia sp.]|nr:glycosyltransferase [Aldersonia sp.]